MNTAELSKAIGRRGQLASNGLLVTVTVLDARIAYNRVDYLVEPAMGSGQVWVSSSRVRFADEKEVSQ